MLRPRKWIVQCALLAASSALQIEAVEPTPEGLWKTIDDKTGRPRGFVRIWFEKGEYFGRIESSLSPADKHAICEECRDERKNQPVIGMLVLRHMRRRGAEFVGGDILDPDTGSIYRCTIRLAEGGRKMLLRGFIGFSLLGRTQTWLRE